MKVKPKREYEVFNMTERRWEKRTMSEDQYQELLKVEKILIFIKNQLI